MTTYLVLDKKLDALNWSSGSLRDGGGDTSHKEINHEWLWMKSVKSSQVDIGGHQNHHTKCRQAMQPSRRTGTSSIEAYGDVASLVDVLPRVLMLDAVDDG